MQYGFQRLALLNSAGYSRAELPLDGAVSLVAPNNTGKTSLINALQFLLIIDRRRMDFGAHDFDASRRFYFPHNSAYVLLEVSLPETGTIVLGCVGKGVSLDYEYFAYAGSLDVEDFRLPDGNIVPQPKLSQHLATRQRRVFSYGSSEFADMVYGGRRSRQNQQQDFCVFRLENASDASVFQRILTRTLRLDKLRSGEVKEYLLQIFRRSLPDAGIDFKAEWDKAFADLNAERAQYLAALSLRPALDSLEQKQDARLGLRGKLLVLRPMIEDALSRWQKHFESRRQALQQQLDHFNAAQSQLRDEERQLVREQSQHEQVRKQLQEENGRLEALQRRFTLISDRSMLETRRQEIQEKRDTLIFRIEQARTGTTRSVQRDLDRIERELEQLRNEQRTQGSNLYQKLAARLSPTQLGALNRTLSRPVLTLGEADFSLDAGILASHLQTADDDSIQLPGLSLKLSALPVQHQQHSAAELEELLRDLSVRADEFRLQLRAASEQAQLVEQRQTLDRQLADCDAELRDYDDMLALQQSHAQRQTRLHDLEKRLHELNVTLEGFERRHQALEAQRQQQQNDLQELQQRHRLIEQRRNQRLDLEGQFTWLADMPHHVWHAQPDFALDELADRLHTHLTDCRQLLDLDEQIRHLLREIHAGGLTRYQLLGNDEQEIERLAAFAHALPQEAEALERKARSAVVNVAASLRELRDGLLRFKQGMREFNRKIGGRQLSDLAVFRIEPEDESHLVEAIELLISTAETVDTGETFELFNQQSLLDDDKLNRAKTLLIEEGNARNGLRVADLFRLRFQVGKAGRAPEAFDDLDSAASNGTVLMAKLVTGLAMLHLLQDQRRPIQGICYLDEALSLDARNQRSLIATAAEFGFSLIFASPAPLTTARYCVPIHQQQGSNQISRFSWQIIEALEPDT